MSIREIRKSKGLTMLQVAQRVGVSEAMISLIERKVRVPSVKLAKKLAPIYEVDWMFFFQE